jgi:LCP family protein required for cell wall assembly
MLYFQTMEFRKHKHSKRNINTDEELMSDGPRRRGMISLSELDEDLSIIEDQGDQFYKSKKKKPRVGVFRRIWGFLKFTILLAILVFGFLLVKGVITGSGIISRSGDIRAIALKDSFELTDLKGEGDGRVNILLIGIGGLQHQGGELSDVNMVVSIDPISKDVAMISIPRDLYVPIPGNYSTRINAAYSLGEQESEGSGAKLAVQTVEKVLGVPIHYYARVDFTGFEQAIDAVGGVDVVVEKSLYDPSFPAPGLNGYEPFRISAGKQHLDGRTALRYARCRKGNCGDDYGRAQRQQQVLVALKDKALSLGTLSNPSKVYKLISAIGDHAKTDLNQREIKKLLEIAKDIDTKQKIQSEVIGSGEAEDLIVSSKIGGADVLVPSLGISNFSAIQAFARELFVDGFIKQEAAKVVVLNGTLRPGLATTTSDLLKSYGYNVVTVGDAKTQDNLESKIYYQTKKDDSKSIKKDKSIAYLEKRFGTKSSKVSKELSAQYPSADIIIVVGSDYSQD